MTRVCLCGATGDVGRELICELFDYGTETKIDAPSGTTREPAFRLAQVGLSRRKVHGFIGLKRGLGQLLDFTG